MTHHNLDFHNKTERYRGEIAYAKQQRMIKEAQRAGMKIPPLVSVKPLVMAIAPTLARFSSLFASWSRRLNSRYKALPSPEPLESQSSPCS